MVRKKRPRTATRAVGLGASPAAERDEQKRLIVGDAKVLEGLLADDPALPQRLASLIAAILDGSDSPDPQAELWSAIGRMPDLHDSVGRLAANALFWSPTRLSELTNELVLPPRTAIVLRNLNSSLGPAFRRAVRAAKSPLDWHAASAQVKYNADRELLVSIVIARDDGQRLVLETSLRAYVHLQSQIVDGLRSDVKFVSKPDFNDIQREVLKLREALTSLQEHMQTITRND